jgi:Localisation of periplasmic protein complexes.
VKYLPTDSSSHRPTSCCKFRRVAWSTVLPASTLLGSIFLASVVLDSNVHAQNPPPKARNARSTNSAPKQGVAAIKSFRIVEEEGGQAVEILSTRPVVPSIQSISAPDRVVIDLPNARLETHSKRIKVNANHIAALRADQYQQNPPVTRVVVDLLGPRAYTWDSSGNRVVVHLGKNLDSPKSPVEAPSIASVTRAPPPVVTAVRADGPLAISASDGSRGSSFTAGADRTVLRLSTGGEIHVCPGTTVGVTPSRNQHNLLISMSDGALETHLVLDASADSVITPDFRILFSGPGEFHYAVNTDNQGNTCVRALPGNANPATVYELLGDRTYQVNASDHIVFGSGRLDRVDTAATTECGCAAQHDTPLRASRELLEQTHQDGTLSTLKDRPPSETASLENSQAPMGKATETSSDTSPVKEVKVQLDAPLVFHATGPPPKAAAQEVGVQIYSDSSVTVPASSATDSAGNAPQPQAGTASIAKAPKKGFFRRVGGAFASIFR